MEINKLLDNLCGLNDKGESKIQLGCYLYEHNLENPENHKELFSAITNLPEFHLYMNGGIVQIDLTFPSEGDTDFYKISEMTQRRLDLEMQHQDKGYVLIFNVLPTDADEDVGYMEMFNPIISCITSLAPRKPATTLRMLFNPEDVQFYEAEFDTTNASLEADFEIRKRDDADKRREDVKRKKQAQADYIDGIKKKYGKEY